MANFLKDSGEGQLFLLPAGARPSSALSMTISVGILEIVSSLLPHSDNFWIVE